MPERQARALPKHVAIIMDGNGRWAEARKKTRIAGHKEGRNSVEKVIRAAAEMGINTLSLFAFSTENWSRPTAEVSAIMQMIQRGILEEAERLRDENIRIRILGKRENLPAKLCEKFAWAERITAHCSLMQVVFAINYSGHWAILEAAKTLAAKVARGELSVTQIDEAAFNAARPMPDLLPVDLLIRSSGELRISNFHLWESAYAEFYFTKVLWPDFGEAEFSQAIHAYQHRERRYGGLIEVDTLGVGSA